MNSLVRAVLAAAILAGSACASVPMAPADFDSAAKAFAPPPPDRAHVYVYRNESFGGAVKMDLFMDGLPAGSTVSKTFALVPVRPGPHKFVSKAENDSELPLLAQPGQNIFVWQEVKMGFLYARNKLQLVSPQQGQAGVLECKLIGAPPPPLPALLPAPPPPAPPAQPSVMPPPPAAAAAPAAPTS